MTEGNESNENSGDAADYNGWSLDAGAGGSLEQLPRDVDERGLVELPAAGRLPRVMLPDASDLFWGCPLTQVSKEELVAGVSFMDMSHEPLPFLSGVFRASQLC